MVVWCCRAVGWPHMNNGWRTSSIDPSTGPSRAGQSGRCWPLFCPLAKIMELPGFTWLMWLVLFILCVGEWPPHVHTLQLCLRTTSQVCHELIPSVFYLPCLSVRPPTTTDPASSCPKVTHSPFKSGPWGPGRGFPKSGWKPRQERRDWRLPSPRGLRHENQLIWTQGRSGETKGSRRQRE